MIALSILFLILAIVAHTARDAVLFYESEVHGYPKYNIFPDTFFWQATNQPYQNDACHWFEKLMWLFVGCAWLVMIDTTWAMRGMGLVFWAVAVFGAHEFFLHGIFTKKVK